MIGLIPHRYAKALYKYALESKTTGEIYGEMKNVVNAFAGNVQMSRVLGNPFVESKEKEKLLIAAAGEKPSEGYRRFVKLVLEHRREDMFQLMSLAYRDIYRKENKISQVKITTAAALGDKDMQRLHQVVEHSFPDSKFEWEQAVNPDIIGGFIIDVDSTRMDASINGELEQLRQNLITGN